MRVLLLLAILAQVGCTYGLRFNADDKMTPAQMLDRASLVFIGVIQQHRYDSFPFFRSPVPGEDYWRILRRRVRVETVVRGVRAGPDLDVYEIFWTGGATGNWNATWDGERALFMVTQEGSRYHVVCDWVRSIFPVGSGYHSRLPLTDATPFWERFALLEYWPAPGISLHMMAPRDPAATLSFWRTAKLMRGFLRHPDRSVHVGACGWLADLGYGQDECWDQLTPAERRSVEARPEEQFASNRRNEALTRQHWARELKGYRNGFPETLSELRLFTTVRDPQLRAWACHQYEREFPGDHDNGCPATEPPPATIVTADGDVPLHGPWPDMVQ